MNRRRQRGTVECEGKVGGLKERYMGVERYDVERVGERRRETMEEN